MKQGKLYLAVLGCMGLLLGSAILVMGVGRYGQQGDSRSFHLQQLSEPLGRASTSTGASGSLARPLEAPLLPYRAELSTGLGSSAPAEQSDRGAVIHQHRDAAEAGAAARRLPPTAPTQTAAAWARQGPPAAPGGSGSAKQHQAAGLQQPVQQLMAAIGVEPAQPAAGAAAGAADSEHPSSWPYYQSGLPQLALKVLTQEQQQSPSSAAHSPSPAAVTPALVTSQYLPERQYPQVFADPQALHRYMQAMQLNDLGLQQAFDPGVSLGVSPEQDCFGWATKQPELKEPFHPSMLVRNRTVPTSWGSSLTAGRSSRSSGAGSGIGPSSSSSSSSSSADKAQAHRGLRAGRKSQQQQQQQEEGVVLPPALFRWDAPKLTKAQFDGLPVGVRTSGDHTGCVQCTDMVRYKVFQGRLYRRRTAAAGVAQPTSDKYMKYYQRHGVEEMLLLAVFLYNLPDTDFLLHWGDGAAAGFPAIGYNLDTLDPKGGFGMTYVHHWFGPNALSLPQSLAWGACVRQRYRSNAALARVAAAPAADAAGGAAEEVRQGAVIPKAVWRGSTSDPYHTPATPYNLLHMARVQLHMLGLVYPDLLDTRITRIIQHGFIPPEGLPLLKMLDLLPTGEVARSKSTRSMPAEQYQRYAVVLDVDGNGWSSRLWDLLQSSAAPLLKQASRFAAWYEGAFAPGLHLYQFDPLLRDLPRAAAELVARVMEEQQQQGSSSSSSSSGGSDSRAGGALGVPEGGATSGNSSSSSEGSNPAQQQPAAASELHAAAAGQQQGAPDRRRRSLRQQQQVAGEAAQQQQQQQEDPGSSSRRQLHSTLGSQAPTSVRGSIELLLQQDQLQQEQQQQEEKQQQQLLPGLEAQALNRQLVAAVLLNKWSMLESLAYTLKQYNQHVVGWQVRLEEGQYDLVPFSSLSGAHGNLPQQLRDAMAAAG